MPRFCANLTMLFTEHPFLERFDAAARAGFTAVEFLFPYEEDAADIRAALDRNGLTLALFNTPPGDWAAGERGLAAVPGSAPEFRESFERALDYVEVLEPQRLHVMAGNASGKGAQASFVENLHWATERAPEQMLTIEPLNTRDNPSYFLNRTDQAMAIIGAVGASNLALQFDFYHVQIMEGDLTRRLERLIGEIGHIQIAGVPERHEPDCGEISLDYVMDLLDRLEYAGWVGCEYRPIDGTEPGLGWLKALGG